MCYVYLAVGAELDVHFEHQRGSLFNREADVLESKRANEMRTCGMIPRQGMSKRGVTEWSKQLTSSTMGAQSVVYHHIPSYFSLHTAVYSSQCELCGASFVCWNTAIFLVNAALLELTPAPSVDIPADAGLSTSLIN